MYSYPNEQGRFGDFGGKFVPETLMQPLEGLNPRASNIFWLRPIALSADRRKSGLSDVRNNQTIVFYIRL